MLRRPPPGKTERDLCMNRHKKQVLLQNISSCFNTSYREAVVLSFTTLILLFVGQQETQLAIMKFCSNNPQSCQNFSITSSPQAVNLSWLENAYYVPFWVVVGILTHKVDQTCLLFGVQSGFISSSVHARLQVSVCIHAHLFTYLTGDFDP